MYEDVLGSLCCGRELIRAPAADETPIVLAGDGRETVTDDNGGACSGGCTGVLAAMTAVIAGGGSGDGGGGGVWSKVVWF
jgi:hypothetical protein